MYAHFFCLLVAFVDHVYDVADATGSIGEAVEELEAKIKSTDSEIKGKDSL